MNRSILLALSIAVMATACKEKPKAEPAPVPPAPVQEPAPASPAANVNANVEAADLEQVPVQEDFEEKARLVINAENLDAEIESLERETAE
ncbi:MAG TPA: hypothetical protein VGK73_24360 [Polyangiaceae bacterium]